MLPVPEALPRLAAWPQGRVCGWGYGCECHFEGRTQTVKIIRIIYNHIYINLKQAEILEKRFLCDCISDWGFHVGSCVIVEVSCS